jgi:hypothetical protein
MRRKAGLNAASGIIPSQRITYAHLSVVWAWILTIFDGELQQKGRLLAGMLYWNSGGPLGQVAVEQTKHCRVKGRIDCCQARLYRASTSKAPQPPCQPIPQLKGGFAINHDFKSMSLR